MTESTMDRDAWLAQIERGIQAKVGDEWNEDRWTEFLKDVAWWLHNEMMDDEDTIDAAVGLIKYGIMEESDLIRVAGSPPDNEAFNRKLKAEGVLPIVCDMLFDKYVAPALAAQRKSEKEFSLAHVKGIKVDDAWVDCGKGFDFIGRDAFSKQVKSFLVQKLKSPPSNPVKLSTSSSQNEPERDIKVSSALVYSSVSGTGKTVSMLQLKSTLNLLNGIKVIVAYLGFNTDLQLNEVESQYIKTHQLKGATDVLARRLAGATIISDCNPNVVTKLPKYSAVYEGFEIPSAETSKGLILKHTGATKETPIYIVAGVDEVQLLNSYLQVDSPRIGLGRLFLRILRRWQHEWHENGIRLLPLGTGIAVDWTADPTTGLNVPLHGDDTTLISKEGFHELVRKVVDSLSDVVFKSRFSSGTTKETVVDLIAASYWPRVRLLEWWRDDETAALKQRYGDSNAVQWVNWLCHWLRSEDFSCAEDIAAVPGKDDKEGKIHCLFELSENSQNFSVIPDGYSSHSMIKILKRDLPVPLLYEGLDIIRSLDPNEFIPKDAYAFEQFGFHAVGTAIHVGLHALRNKIITSTSANKTQEKRLGLALWFQERKAVTHQEETILVPRVLGRVYATGTYGDFYPFNALDHTSFEDDVVSELKKSAEDFRPVYIRCGRRMCCDYLYFYVCRSSRTKQKELICNIDDAKHTNNVESGGGGEKITTADQQGLFDAVIKVHSAVKSAGLILGDVRLLFVSNRNSLAKPMPNSVPSRLLETSTQAAQELFPHVKLEVLNKETFEFGPYSDILSARRKKESKRKREDV